MSGRLHHLDALRALAMLLGIVLHVALAFSPHSYPVRMPGATWDSAFDECFDFIHGFRMPLFFLLSGFFTALLTEARGLRALLVHRVKRVLLPLLLSILLLLPLTQLAVDFSSYWLREVPVPALHFPEPFSLKYLWFLWQLLLMVAGFTLVRLAARVIVFPRRAELRHHLSWLAPALLLLMGLSFQLQMAGAGRRSFGVELSPGLLPAPYVLGYYSTFFATGTLLYGRSTPQGRPLLDALGARWRLLLPLSAGLVFPAALLLTRSQHEPLWPAAALLQLLFAWGMSLGSIGLCQHLLDRELAWVRFTADASYWMYLVHLPVVLVLQALAVNWELPLIWRFVLICLATVAVLLLSYRYCVRYTVVGRFLNGPRSRPARSQRKVDRVVQAPAA